jgi:hypothetical protein
VRKETILKGISDVGWLIISKELLDGDAYQKVCSAGFDIAVDLDRGCGERKTLKTMRGFAGKLVYAVGLPGTLPLWCESGGELTLGRAVKQDVHALFRTFMICSGLWVACPTPNGKLGTGGDVGRKVCVINA